MKLVKKNGHVRLVDDGRVSRYIAEGYTLLDSPEDKPAKAPEDKPIGKMTVDELKAYAAKNGIELPEGAAKSDILATIKNAAEGGGEDGKNNG